MRTSRRLAIAIALVATISITFPALTAATHSWGGYHWARTSNPFTLKLGDNVSTAWDAYLATTSSDWSASSVLDTTIVAGLARPKNCRPTAGRVEVCNASYGNNGWLGVAQIWVSGGTHITQGTAKVNDFYFNMASYNTPAWRRMVMCQEVAHTFGLGHQDETQSNANLGSCMDYTNDPDGGAGGASATDPSNEHPNAHDFAQLETIYAHLDSTTTLASSVQAAGAASGWGRLVAVTNGGRTSVYVAGAGDQLVISFVIWAN
ncbi:MAG TPA: hypothetical protein VJA85_02890 [Candidatus Limnocylindria bacterium]|nr:hypothetical protein [Candidatus Limnocylindria bacterium]